MTNNQDKNIDKDKVINKKRKTKKIAILGGIIVVVGIASTMMYGNINKVQNEFVSVSGTVSNLKSNMIDRNKLILSVKDEIKKYDAANILLEQIELENNNLNKLSKPGSENYYPQNTQEINENFEVLKGVEKSVDKLIEVYNSNEDMKKNKLLADAFEEVMSYDSTIEYIVESYNIEYKDKFNECINKLPINMMKKIYNIQEMDTLNLK